MKYKYLLVVYFILIICVSCAYQQSYKFVQVSNTVKAENDFAKVNKLLSPPEGKAILYIQYDDPRTLKLRVNCKSAGCGRESGSKVILNNKEIDRVYTNSYTRLVMEPGQYHLKMKWYIGLEHAPIEIPDFVLKNGDVKTLRYTVPIGGSRLQMIYPGGFSPVLVGSASINEIDDIEHIVESMPHLSTPEQIEKDWESW